METYRNDYTKEEDDVLWELHEIRHEIHKENEGKSLEEINSKAKLLFAEYKRKLIK